MDELLAALKASPNDTGALLSLLSSMTRKLSAFEDALIALEPHLQDAPKAKLRATLAQELLLDG